jgi:hypothetical protein
MTTWLLNSTDTGAPTLNNVAGSFIAVLDAFLVNGWNSTSTGWTAAYNTGVITYTKTGHGMPVGAKGVVCTITGFSPSGYNKASQTFTVTDANNMTIASADPGGAATGTATVLRSPLGWTKAFSGTNLASYQMAAGSNQRYLGVDDTTTTQARVRGFLSMTAAGVAAASGTEPFPTDGQLSGGGYCWKGSAGTVPYIVVSDGKMVHFQVQQTNTTVVGGGMRFGDFYSRLTGDVYNTMIVADIAASATLTNIRMWNLLATMGATSGCFVLRPYTGIAGSLAAGQVTDTLRVAAATEMGTAGATYPHPIEGGMVLAPVWLSEGSAANGCRGTIPGLWNPCHVRPANHLDTFSGVGGTSLANKTFIMGVGGGAGCQALEITDTWSAPT